MLKTTMTKAFIFGLAVMLLAAPNNVANAATGATSVTVNVGEHIVLHYTPTLTLTVTGVDTQVAEAAFAGNIVPATTTLNAGLTTGTLTSLAAEPSSIAVTVQNAWAVRGVTAAGTMSASIASAGSATRTVGATTSTITAGSATLSSAGLTTGATLANFADPGLGKPNARLGDMNFTLDLSGVLLGGAHTGLTLTISVVTP